ncbi:unnamed protein product [Moneuplotes crassus]|uniref:Uncharacterized protein n=1 Tax=Euplotes crassus TaxID=5936 RepID=A0AAD1U6X2_EUPCR|nr:unnamed protein product [Moneuplotes crassus]
MTEGRKSPEYYQAVITRWRESSMTGQQHEDSFLKLQREFRKYYPNIYILNRKALIIQHAVFGWLAGFRGVTTRLSKSQMSSSQILFKPRYKLNEVSRPSSVKRKVHSKVDSGLFDNKENYYERSVHISPIHIDNPKRSRVNSNGSECRPKKLSCFPRPHVTPATSKLTPRENKMSLLDRNKNLGTSLRNITNVIYKAVGKYNDTKLTRMEDNQKSSLSAYNKTEYKTVSKPFRPSSTLTKAGDGEYERQQKEKEARISRIKEARRKYSKPKLKTNTRNSSCFDSNSIPISKRQSPSDRKNISQQKKKVVSKSNIKLKNLSPTSKNNKISHMEFDKENHGSFNRRPSKSSISSTKIKSSLMIVPKINNSGSRLPQTSRMTFQRSKEGNYKLTPSTYGGKKTVYKPLSSSIKSKTQGLKNQLKEINKDQLSNCEKEKDVYYKIPRIDLSGECPEIELEYTSENPEHIIKYCHDLKSQRSNPKNIPNYQKTTFSVEKKKTLKKNQREITNQLQLHLDHSCEREQEVPQSEYINFEEKVYQISCIDDGECTSEF